MVSAPAKPIELAQDYALFIYITGCDGTGKTTQARLLLEQLRAAGVKTRHVWLRFPFLFSLPLLAYARWRGYSWFEVTDGIRHGYWDFHRSWLMRSVFPWVLLLDSALAAIWKIYLPLWAGRTLVCERFALDMLVDLAVGLEDPDFQRQLPGRLYFHLLPTRSKVFILDLDAATLRSRRADLISDTGLEGRLEAFRSILAGKGYTRLSSQSPVMELNGLILEEILLSDPNG